LFGTRVTVRPAMVRPHTLQGRHQRFLAEFMASGVPAPPELTAISEFDANAQKPFHAGSQAGLPCPNYKVEVVAHRTTCMDLLLDFGARLIQQSVGMSSCR